MNYVNPIYTSDEAIHQLAQDFNNAKPYRHLIIDNFLKEDIANTLHDNFPSIDGLKKHYKGLNENKSEGANFDDFHESFRELRGEMMSQELWDWASKVLSIDNLFITDDKLGIGLHQGGDGSFLDIHIDFNIHVEKDVHRRANLLIYMNKDWLPEYGGDLEMWNADMTKCEKKVAPLFNRVVIFETNEISYHGYSKVHLPEGLTRKSVYSYFYTEQRDGAAKYHDTVFKTRPEEGSAKRIKTTVKENLKNFTKASLKKIGIKI